MELIRRTVAETLEVLVLDPDIGLELKPSFKKEVINRLKDYKRSELVPFSKIKKSFTNA